MRSGSDPITEDPAELDARADQDEREQFWDNFVAAIKARKAELHHWSDVISEAADALLADEEGWSSSPWAESLFELACSEFADLEGWHGVLSAIARAMREQAKASL